MNDITYTYVHPNFKFNGVHFDRIELQESIEVFIKEGDAFEKELGAFIFEWFNKNSYIEMTTSGTTGKPKKVKIKKQAMVNSALATGAFFNLLPNDKVLHCLPVKFIAGKMMFVRALILGLDMDFVTTNTHPLEKNVTKYDFAAMVPLQVENSLEELKNVKKLIIGGAKMSDVLKQEVLKLSTECYETYGMTETITHIAAKKVYEDAFTLLPGISISVDENNCLIINAPRITKKEIKTNDIVELVNEEQFVLLGRVDNVINSGGVKIMPEQIEEQLSEKIKGRFFLAGLPDESLGEKLVLVIEGEDQNLDKVIFNDLQKFEKPKSIFYVPTFIETHTGKIMRSDTLGMIL